jgi:hypothetical protein
LRRICARSFAVRERQSGSALSAASIATCLGSAQVRHRAEQLSRRGIEDLFHLAVGGALPAAGDERLLAEQRHVAQGE